MTQEVSPRPPVRNDRARRPATPTLAGILGLAAAATAAIAAWTLILPDTPVSAVWGVKPAEYAQLRALGLPAALGFVALSAVALIAALGALGRRRWSWWLIVLGLSINAAADAARIASGAPAEGAIGLAIAAVILWWMLRPAVRRSFSARAPGR